MMKTKALILGLGLVAAAFAVQDAVKFERAYKVGDRDDYRFSITASTMMGDADIQMIMSQVVKKVHDNGEADIETTIGDMKLMFMGNEMPMPGGQTPPPTTSRVNKYGMPVGEQARGGGGGMMGMMGGGELMRLGTMMMDKPMTVGQTIPFEQVDANNPRNKVVGTVLLESIKDGIAVVVTKSEIHNANSAQPMKVDVRSQIEMATNKPKLVEGNVTGIPEQGGMQIDGAKFRMERLPSSR
jgi:hypothetical protein